MNEFVFSNSRRCMFSTCFSFNTGFFKFHISKHPSAIQNDDLSYDTYNIIIIIIIIIQFLYSAYSRMADRCAVQKIYKIYINKYKLYKLI